MTKQKKRVIVDAKERSNENCRKEMIQMKYMAMVPKMNDMHCLKSLESNERLYLSCTNKRWTISIEELATSKSN